MADLQLAGVKDGTHLVLRDAEGTEYTLPIDDNLRSAVRRERPVPRESAAEPVTPREIQQMLRAGATVDEVAEFSGIDPERIERFESPVSAERAWIVQQSMALPVGRHPDSPVLGDLAVDRLALRQVAPDSLEWDAVRSGSDPWTLRLDFHVEGRMVRASWEVDLQARSIHALDDEARWLSETDAGTPQRRRGLGNVVTAFPARGEQRRAGDSAPEESADPTAAENAPAGTDALLDSLKESRGTRQPLVEFGDDPDLLDSLEEDSESSPARTTEVRPSEREAQIVSLTERRSGESAASPAGSSDSPKSAATPAEAPVKPKSSSRRTRRSVPSWDEIVFGSKGD